MSPNVVSGTIATVADLGRDETWLQGWLREHPTRLGLGDLTLADGEPVQDEDGNPAFVAADDSRYFCVDVRLGELEASHGFGVLHNWARNRVRHPDKNHVAVLVTESAGERYRATLEALSEHLPLVVVELQVWRGEHEAIVVPHVALASDDVDLSATPAAAAARAVAGTAASTEATLGPVPGVDAPDAKAAGDEAAVTSGPGTAAESEATDGAETSSEPAAAGKDDTGIDDPWRLPRGDAVESGAGIHSSLIGVTSG